MTATTSRKLSVNRKSLLWQAPTLLILLLLARFFWLRSEPERLRQMELHPGQGAANSDFKISGDSIYMPLDVGQQVSGPPTVMAGSIYGGEMREVTKEEAHHQFYATAPFNTVDGALNYAIEPNSSSDPDRRYSGAMGTHDIPGQFLGTFLPPPNGYTNTQIAGLKRVALTQWPLPTHDVQFRQVSLRGGAPRNTQALRGEGFCLVGNNIFWIRSRPEQSDRIIQGKTHWTEVTAHSDLMLTSLTDGATHCIRTGISRSDYLNAGESGILFSQPMPFPNRPMLFYARAADGSVCALGTASEGKTEGHVMEFGGRLYWTRQNHSAESDGSYVTTLMSANPDGTDSHELLAQWNKHPVGDLALHEYQGRLYCFLDRLPPASEEDGKRIPYLCRLYPERSDPVEMVRRLPDSSSQYRFEGGYLYFVVKGRSLWATITDRSSVSSEDTLCRVPLP